jgi:hypothetical protein
VARGYGAINAAAGCGAEKRRPNVKIENIGCRSADLRIGDRHYCFDGRDDEYPDGEVDLTVADALEVPEVRALVEYLDTARSWQGTTTLDRLLTPFLVVLAAKPRDKP